MALRGPGRPELAPGEARTVKITVYVRPKDEALMNAVAGAKGKRLSGWAYEVLLREANREAARKKLPPPDPKQRKK